MRFCRDRSSGLLLPDKRQLLMSAQQQMLIVGGSSISTDPNFSSVVLLLHFNGTNGQTTTTDSSNSHHVMTNSSSIVLTTSKFKWGTASSDFTGAAGGCSWTSPDSADWDFGSGQFTIEGWIYFNATGSYTFAGQWAWSTQLAWSFEMTSSTILFRYSSNGSGNGTTVSGSWSPAINTWYHVCVDRDASNVLRVYVDGVIKASATVAVTFWNSTNVLEIGCDIASGRLNGYIDDVRITKGVARYGGTFTPPSAEFPNS
jgi:hypothetical protein